LNIHELKFYCWKLKPSARSLEMKGEEDGQRKTTLVFQ
jgi:hypothetical protein